MHGNLPSDSLLAIPAAWLEEWDKTVQTIQKISFDITHGLSWVVKTGWKLWAGLFDSLPYGNPYIAAIAAGLVFVVVDKIVRPRHPTHWGRYRG